MSILWAPKQKGFTIVELLIVIVVIAILATITVVAFNGINSKARDAVRAQDMVTIKKALMAYDAVNGGVLRSTSVPRYNEEVVQTGRGGWDVSIDDNWLAFLRPSYGKMPVDPQNKASDTGLGSLDNNSRTYRYFCYIAGTGVEPASDHVVIAYRKDSGSYVQIVFPVSSCK